MEKYINGDFEKVHMAVDETLKNVGKGNIKEKVIKLGYMKIEECETYS